MSLSQNGQPPRSAHLNKYATDISADSAIVAKQIDYLSSKTISTFNLFSSEIEKESNFLERINSKIKVLQLYSKSSSEDIYYYGDSFDNFDNIDTSAKYDLPLASTVDGFLSLPIVDSSVWAIDSLDILDKDENGNKLSNGFLGNSHMAIQDTATTTEVLTNTASSYKYIFEGGKSLNNVAYAYRDKNPDTYFEYEKLKVTNSRGASQDYEFQYKNKINNQNLIYQWNNSDDTPLKLVLQISKRGSAPANSISITPFFGYDEINITPIKITSIMVETIDPSFEPKEEILSSPITVGPTAIPTSVTDSNNFFFKKAVIKFAERNVSKVTVTIEQSSSAGVNIKHAYWTVASVNANYEFSATDYVSFGADSKPVPEGIWSSSSRFNPSLIYNRSTISSITGVESSLDRLIPSISNPTEITGGSDLSRRVTISGVQDVPVTYYVMKAFDKKKNKYVYVEGLKPFSTLAEYDNELRQVPLGSTPLINWWPATNEILGYDTPANAGSFGAAKAFYSSTNINDPKYDAILRPFFVNPNYIPATPGYGVAPDVYEWWALKYKLTGVEKNSGFKGTATPSYFLGERYNLTEAEIIPEQSQKITKPKVRYNINLNKNYEIIRDGASINDQTVAAKRWSIGLRDISVGNELYNTSAEIISKPFNFPYPVEYLMLYSDYTIPIAEMANEFSEQTEFISYYISVEGKDGPWLPISPVENPFNSNVPEIYSFSKNVSSELRIPGIAYIDTTSEINSVRVRIKIRKPNVLNGTPLINYYQLAAKVKRA
jgi:hypothetical protein